MEKTLKIKHTKKPILEIHRRVCIEISGVMIEAFNEDLYRSRQEATLKSISRKKILINKHPGSKQELLNELCQTGNPGTEWMKAPIIISELYYSLWNNANELMPNSMELLKIYVPHNIRDFRDVIFAPKPDTMVVTMNQMLHEY